MLIVIRLRSVPVVSAANALASSVLPVPVCPRNRKEATGRLPGWRPARERRIADATAEMAGS